MSKIASGPLTVGSLSSREATRIALHAQALRGPRLTGGPNNLVHHLRGVQLDTISVLARSHELVAYARLGAIPRKKIEAAYWGAKSETFEYWSHAACVLPIELWPAFGAKRRARTQRGFRWHQLKDHKKSCADVIQRLRSDGPLTSRELGGAKKGGTWWDWSEVKIAAEWLLDTGMIVCRERRGFERVYDLAERSIPSDLLSLEFDDETCAEILVGSALRALGVATAVDLAAYHGTHVNTVRAVLRSRESREVHVEGWRDVAYMSEHAEAGLARGLRGPVVLLSPFDSLLWDRARLERLFQTTYRLEAYVPATKRVVGYFAMPILVGDRLVGLVDPKRIGDTLHARHVVINTPSAVDHIALALRNAASWVGCDKIVIDRVTPASSLPSLRASVASTN
ncbi:MAG TPA: crosslink repair DNA glycosylase YcaQ family protein [Acidimicrobiales bacterium]